MADVLFETRGRAGIITLNRESALNALNYAMVEAIAAQLALWANAPQIERIILKGSGEKAFCAGGDIRFLHDAGKDNNQAAALKFWHDEYLLNITLKNFKKPLISLLNGIVMGGGVGLSVHGHYRVASEKFTFAMPEVGIGFFPDVGGGYFLPRLPNHFGTFLAITGERIKLGDGVACGIVTHSFESKATKELLEALCQTQNIDETLAKFHVETSPALFAHKGSIERAFKAETVEDIITRLKNDVTLAQDAFAAKTLATMHLKSPTSMKIALEQVKRGAKLTFEQVMQMEYRIVSRICYGHDFYEGVRAVIIDKDNAPKWQPETLEAVSKAAIEAYFSPLEKELTP
jgi:enoyl-CoA hydratase